MGLLHASSKICEICRYFFKLKFVPKRRKRGKNEVKAEREREELQSEKGLAKKRSEKMQKEEEER